MRPWSKSKGPAAILLASLALAGVADERREPLLPAGPPVERTGSLPFSFEPNRGQADPAVKFLARGRGCSLLVTSAGASLLLPPPPGSPSARPGMLRMRLRGGSRSPRIEGIQSLAGRVNYLRGDPSRWQRNLPTYARVRCAQVYPGIDLVYYGAADRLEFDFLLEPGASPEQIGLVFEEVGGSPRVEIDELGDLLIHARSGVVRQRKPLVYQEIDGVRREIEAGYAVRSRPRPPSPGEGGSENRSAEASVGFRVGARDLTRPLVIDPVIVYSTFLGGTGAENYRDGELRLCAIAADQDGAAYVAGTTTSTDFPATAGSLQTAYAGPAEPERYGDAFVAKISSDGSSLVYATYLGGSGTDSARDIAVDAGGHAFVTGETASADFPLAGPIQGSLIGSSDAFISRLTPDGSALVFSTFLGGDASDSGRCICVAPGGEACVAGFTVSVDFPTVNAMQPDWAGRGDAFVVRLNAAGSAFVYSTYLGGNNGQDEPTGIATDASGRIYVVGTTGGQETNSFPVRNPIQRYFGGGFWDFFAVKLDEAGALIYSTYLGGSGTDYGHGVAVDAEGNSYITGYIESKDFPLSTTSHTAFGPGPRYACVVKIDPEGTRIIYTSFITANFGVDIGLRADGNVYVVGDTDRRSFPVRTEMPPNFAAGSFVARLSPNGDSILSTSFLLAAAQACAVDSVGNVYLTGDAFLRNFQTASAIQAAPARRCPGRVARAECEDAFVAKISSALGEGGRLVVSPARVRFPVVAAGGPPLSRSLRVKNTGRGALVVLVGWCSPPFSAEPRGEEVILFPGQSRLLQVGFQPAAAGKYAGKLSITSTDVKRPVVHIPITGRAR